MWHNILMSVATTTVEYSLQKIFKTAKLVLVIFKTQRIASENYM